jgi:predicted amidohydrolase YtcJ
MPTFPAADTILTNGSILTVDADFDTVSALAIRDGRILTTGTDTEIAALAGPGTRRIDLAGRTVLPGLIDAHCHMLTTGLLLGDVVLHDCRTIPEVLARVAARAAGTPPGTWIVGRGWDESVLAEGRPPSRDELDEVAPYNPVCLHRVWNKLMANSEALAVAGIGRRRGRTCGRYRGSGSADAGRTASPRAAAAPPRHPSGGA